jgi:hypothetical protein
VIAISRVGFDKGKTKGREAAPFEIQYQNGAEPKTLRTDAVIDASGTWLSPNVAGANGLAAIGETDASDHIAYAMPDVADKARGHYAGKTVAVVWCRSFFRHLNRSGSGPAKAPEQKSCG